MYFIREDCIVFHFTIWDFNVAPLDYVFTSISFWIFNLLLVIAIAYRILLIDHSESKEYYLANTWVCPISPSYL